MSFEYGTAFDFSLALLTSVQRQARSAQSADFLATAILDGMHMFESNGTPVNDFLFSSGRGLADRCGVSGTVDTPSSTFSVRVRLDEDRGAQSTLAAIASTSSRNSGRTSSGTTSSIDAGRASPRKRARTAT